MKTLLLLFPLVILSACNNPADSGSTYESEQEKELRALQANPFYNYQGQYRVVSQICTENNDPITDRCNLTELNVHLVFENWGFAPIILGIDGKTSTGWFADENRTEVNAEYDNGGKETAVFLNTAGTAEWRLVDTYPSGAKAGQTSLRMSRDQDHVDYVYEEFGFDPGIQSRFSHLIRHYVLKPK